MIILHTSAACPHTLSQAISSARSFSEVFDTFRPLSYHQDCHVTIARCKLGQQVVVKTYMRDRLGATALLQVQMEMQIHHSLVHPHVVQLLVAFEDARHIYLVVEYADDGDLRKHMVGLPERRVRDFIAQPLLQALVLLHQEGIVHRDLKPDNVLVHHHQVLLADFGLSMYCAKGAPEGAANDRAAACLSLANSAGGTPLYTAPEVLLAMFKSQPMQEVVQHKNDVWALGVMCLEALTGRHPFSPENCSGYSGNVLYSIAHHKAVTLPKSISPELQDFLSQALQRDPELRPTAEQLLHHPWLCSHSEFRSAAGTMPRALSAIEIANVPLEGDPIADELDRDVISDDARSPDSRAGSDDGHVESAAVSLGQRCRADAGRHGQGKAEEHHHHHLHRVYSAFEMVECWEH